MKNQDRSCLFKVNDTVIYHGKNLKITIYKESSGVIKE